jgi:4-amino-4-deoxy-L-arabinose transferase-like glycosyltransferase
VSWKRTLFLGAVLACGTAVVIAPWTIRNTVVMGEPIAVSTGVADALCMGRHDGADGRFVPSPDCDEGFADVPLADYQLERYHTNTERSITWVRENPLSEVRQWFNRMVWANRENHDGLEQVEPQLSLFQYATLSSLGDGAYFVLVALGLLGARGFARRREPRALLLLLTAVSLAVVPLLLFGDPRYKVPLVPVLAILAAPAALAAWRGSGRMMITAPPTSDGAADGAGDGVREN